jgi:hypothetical protein
VRAGMRINQCFLQQQGLTDRWACHGCGQTPAGGPPWQSTRLSETPYAPRGCNLFIADGYFLLCAASGRLAEPHPTRTVQRAQVFPKARCWSPRPPCWEIYKQTMGPTPNVPSLDIGRHDNTIFTSRWLELGVSWPKCPHVDLQAT